MLGQIPLISLVSIQRTNVLHTLIMKIVKIVPRSLVRIKATMILLSMLNSEASNTIGGRVSGTPTA